MLKILQLRQKTPCRFRTSSEIVAKIFCLEPDVADARLVADEHPRFISDVFRMDVLVGLFRACNSRNVNAALVRKRTASYKSRTFIRNEIGDFIDVSAR